MFPFGFIGDLLVLGTSAPCYDHGSEFSTIQISDEVTQTDNGAAVADTVLDVEDAFGIVVHRLIVGGSWFGRIIHHELDYLY